MKNKVFAFLVKTPFADNPFYSEKCGVYNGYVGIHKSINLPQTYQRDASEKEEFLDNYIKVHGGITLDIASGEYKLSKDKMYPITEIPEDYTENYRILGFDTCHYDDNPYKWDYDNVKNETLNFLQQIKDYIKEHNC